MLLRKSPRNKIIFGELDAFAVQQTNFLRKKSYLLKISTIWVLLILFMLFRCQGTLESKKCDPIDKQDISVCSAPKTIKILLEEISSFRSFSSQSTSKTTMSHSNRHWFFSPYCRISPATDSGRVSSLNKTIKSLLSRPFIRPKHNFWSLFMWFYCFFRSLSSSKIQMKRFFAWANFLISFLSTLSLRLLRKRSRKRKKKLNAWHYYW